MEYSNENGIHLMYSTKGSDVVKFNVSKNHELKKGDTISFNRGSSEMRKIVEVDEVLERRQSTLKDFDYVAVKLTKVF